MSKDTLSVVNSGVSLPGVAFRRNAVEFTGRPKLDALAKALGAVAELEGGTQWWYGDIALEIQAVASLDEKHNGDRDARGDEVEEEAQERRANMGAEYTKTIADTSGVGAGHLWNCAMVARFFRPSCRNEALTWNHHVVAMVGAGGAKGDVKRAKVWLDRAEENKWSVSDMRKQVNMALATAPAADVPAEHNPFEIVDAVDAWLAKRPSLPRMTPEQAQAQLTRWAALITFLRSLEAIAAANN